MEMEKSVNTTKKLGLSFQSDYSNLKLHVYGDTIDELIDGLSRLKDGAFINYFVFKFKKRLTEEQLSRLDEIMLTTDNGKEIVNYARSRKEKIDTQKYQDRLIELKDIWGLGEFESFAIEVDREKIKRFVFEKGTLNEVINFTMWFVRKNADDRFEAKKLVLESKDNEAISNWARWIGDVEEAREAINKIGDEEAIKKFNAEFPRPKKNFFNRFKK